MTLSRPVTHDSWAPPAALLGTLSDQLQQAVRNPSATIDLVEVAETALRGQ